MKVLSLSPAVITLIAAATHARPTPIFNRIMNGINSGVSAAREHFAPRPAVSGQGDKRTLRMVAWNDRYKRSTGDPKEKPVAPLAVGVGFLDTRDELLWTCESFTVVPTEDGAAAASVQDLPCSSGRKGDPKPAPFTVKVLRYKDQSDYTAKIEYKEDAGIYSKALNLGTLLECGDDKADSKTMESCSIKREYSALGKKRVNYSFYAMDVELTRVKPKTSGSNQSKPSNR